MFVFVTFVHNFQKFLILLNSISSFLFFQKINFE